MPGHFASGKSSSLAERLFSGMTEKRNLKVFLLDRSHEPGFNETVMWLILTSTIDQSLTLAARSRQSYPRSEYSYLN
jgi:hypothetical protein